ncbi:MAG TPA: anti-sigma regulatory factor [Polyangiaceae bacterium]
MPDATETVIGMLAQYFPPAIARAVVRSTLRRGGFANDSLDVGDLPDFVSALEQTLPMYIVDLERRGECVERVRELLPHAQRGPAPSPRPRPTPRENGRSPADRAPDSPRDPSDGAASSERLVGGSVRVRSSHDVVQACDLARETARKLEFSLLDQTKIATAASELARNILLYAGDGEVRILKVESPRGLQITAIDSGPGIADIDLVMNGGYRSRTGMGMGLKGAKRLMGELEIRSRLGVGTTVVATKVLR